MLKAALFDLEERWIRSLHELSVVASGAGS